MGLLIQEINELRDMLTMFDGGKLSVEDLTAKLNLYSQTEKRSRLILKAWALGIKSSTNDFSGVKDMLVGDEQIKPPKKQIYDRTSERGK